MKALVLAGGAGTRLRPITYTSAKQLVPLANRPILFFGLDSIAAAGIHEVVIVVGDTEPAIRAAVGDGSAFGLQVSYVRQDDPLGLAHAVLIAHDLLGDDPFVMYLGDNLIVGGIRHFVEEFDRAAPNASIVLTEVEHPEQFGVAEVASDGRLIRLVEKPKDPPSNLALVGLYLFDRHIHDAVRRIKPSGRGELEITDAIQWLVEQGHHVTYEVLTTPWIDTGKRQDLLQANRIVLENLEPENGGDVDDATEISGSVVIEPGAKVSRSVLRGPVAIASGAVVEDSLVGPSSSIGSGCEIRGAEIEHSVLLQGVRVEGVRLYDSLVGRDAVVKRSERPPRAYRLMLSDDSEVEVP